MGAYFRKVWLGFYTVLLGMRVTLKYLLAKPITLQYPDERWDVPDGSRGKLTNNIDDCIGCLACARACPVDCITIETKKPPKGLDLGSTSEGTKKKLVVPLFEIDISTCLFCGLCVEACPTACLTMTKDYEYSTYDREKDLLLHFGKDLDPEVEAAAIKRAEEIEKEEKAAAEKAAAEKAAAKKAEGAPGKSGAEKATEGAPGKPGAEGASKGKPAEEPGASGEGGVKKPSAEVSAGTGKGNPESPAGGKTASSENKGDSPESEPESTEKTPKKSPSPGDKKE